MGVKEHAFSETQKAVEASGCPMGDAALGWLDNWWDGRSHTGALRLDIIGGDHGEAALADLGARILGRKKKIFEWAGGDEITVEVMELLEADLYDPEAPSWLCEDLLRSLSQPPSLFPSEHI